jgi:hypothetical protein
MEDQPMYDPSEEINLAKAKKDLKIQQTIIKHLSSAALLLIQMRNIDPSILREFNSPKELDTVLTETMEFLNQKIGAKIAPLAILSDNLKNVADTHKIKAEDMYLGFDTAEIKKEFKPSIDAGLTSTRIKIFLGKIHENVSKPKAPKSPKKSVSNPPKTKKPKNPPNPNPQNPPKTNPKGNVQRGRGGRGRGRGRGQVPNLNRRGRGYSS